jgi:heme-degrading monooxygenase HmoA
VYFNVFRHYKRAGMDAAAYAADAARMEELARQQKGFLAYKRYSSSDGEALSLSEWETEEDARAWARNAEHAAVQARARSAYYDSYVVYSCPNPNVSRFQNRPPSVAE